MEVTSQSFDMDPKTFTLQAMFAMQLHKFAEEIGKITNAAVKELTIENELKKLADAWRDQRFDVFKYIKVRTRQNYDLAEDVSHCSGQRLAAMITVLTGN